MNTSAAVIPAVCKSPSCGAVFILPPIFGHIWSYGATFSPCPRCGGDAAIVNGHYRPLEDAARNLVLNANPQTLHDLWWLIQELQQRNYPSQQIEKEIEKRFPEARPYLNYIKDVLRSFIIGREDIGPYVIAFLIGLLGAEVHGLMHPSPSAEDRAAIAQQVLQEEMHKGIMPYQCETPPQTESRQQRRHRERLEAKHKAKSAPIPKPRPKAPPPRPRPKGKKR